MKQVVGSLGVLLAVAALTGCGSQQAKAQAPSDVFAAMSAELSHAIAQSDPIDAMDDELSHTIGTTMLTSATLMAAPAPAPVLAAAPADVEPAVRTWGASEPTSDVQD